MPRVSGDRASRINAHFVSSGDTVAKFAGIDIGLIGKLALSLGLNPSPGLLSLTRRKPL